jgi:hypothetical protein
MLKTPPKLIRFAHINKRAEVLADTKYQAQLKLAVMLKAKHSYDVAVELAETDGQQVTHVAVD